MGFLVYEQKGSFFLPRGTGIKILRPLKSGTRRYDYMTVGAVGEGTAGVELFLPATVPVSAIPR